MQWFKKEDKIRISEEARRILDNHLVKGALEGIEQTIFYNFKTSKHSAKEEREELYRQLQSVRAFREKFEYWIRDGQAARNELTQKMRKVV